MWLNHKIAWQDLKEELSNPKLLTAPDGTKRKIVMKDASDFVLGGGLIQVGDESQCRPM